jgi:anti-anti-sigma factor
MAHRREPGPACGRVAGELDIATAPALESTLLHALDSEAASIVLDLERVSFIDSMGLRCVGLGREGVS